MRYAQKMICLLVLVLAASFGLGGCVLLYSDFASQLRRTEAVNADTHRQTCTLLQNEILDRQRRGEALDDAALAALVQQYDTAALWRDGVLIAENPLAPAPLPDAAMQVLRSGGAVVACYGSDLQGGLQLVTCYDLTELYRARGAALRRFLLLEAAVLAAGTAVTALLAGRMTRPLRTLTAVSAEIADGDYTRRTALRTGDEIETVSRSFDKMADAVQEKITALENDVRSREDFMGAFAHELKTPMTTIAGYTDGILDGTIPPENEKQYLRIIANESRRLSRLVRRMLDVSQLQAIDPLRNGNHFDVCESMRRVLISMEKKINDRHLDVEADIPDEPILVLGDNDMITQVIYNLLENAAKFAREGSTLYLGVAMMDGKARITVRNVGETIPAEELPLLFERFHKSDKSRSEDKDGYGLGLYIVKTILQQHKEEINVTSENGVTTFTFSLRVE